VPRDKSWHVAIGQKPTNQNQREMPYWKIIAAHETFLQGMLVPAEQE